MFFEHGLAKKKRVLIDRMAKLVHSYKQNAMMNKVKTFWLCLIMMEFLLIFSGLHSQGLLETLRTFPDEAVSFLAVSDLPSAEDLMKFYEPQYSSDHVKKDLEERVVYNLDRFLKKIESKKC